MHKEQKTVFISCFTYWRLSEKMSLHCIHVLKRWLRKNTIILLLYFEVSFYKWANLITNIKHSFRHHTIFEIDITVV